MIFNDVDLPIDAQLSVGIGCSGNVDGAISIAQVHRAIAEVIIMSTGS